MNVLLKISHLNKVLSGRHIIKDLSLETYAGEVFGLLGPNGAGKTTIIKTVTGFLKIDGGSISVNGYDIEKNYEQAMASMGGIVENPEMYRELSGRCNLEMYARLHDGVTAERIDEVVRLVGLQNRINEKVRCYSLGMKQRLGLAQAILHHPKLLILDEPTNGLDPTGIKELREILTGLAHNEGISVLVSSHLLSEMEHMCDRIGIINNGVLLGVKTVSELHAADSGKVGVYILRVTDTEKATALLVEAYPEKNISVSGDGIRIDISDDDVADIALLMRSNSLPIIGIIREEATLEDAFIRIVGGGNTIA